MFPTVSDAILQIRPHRQRIEKGVESLIVPLVLILSWEFAVRTGILPRSLIASPTEVCVRLFRMIVDLTLPVHAAVSLARLLCGFFLGTLMGIVLGTCVGFSQRAARALEPSVLSLIPVPPIAWIPLLIIFFGIGEYSKIALIAIGSFCTLFIHTAYGVRSADRAYVEVAQIFMKNAAFILRRVLLPSAIPSILSSMRVAMALSWTLLMASEIIASSQGLGWLIWDSRNFSRPDDMLAGMVAVGILGKLTDYLLILAERYLTRWRRTYGGA